MNLGIIKNILLNNPELLEKLEVLKLASELNPEFKTPNITGGYLRDILLGKTSSDCDVVFEGYMKNQPGVLECVKEAEKKLKYEPYDGWEFENFKVSGLSGDIFEDVIGFYSNHTDYLTLIMCDGNKNIRVGSKHTLECLENRLYDIRYQGLLVWLGFRERTYFRAMAGLGCRGMYLCHKLELNISDNAEELFVKFDANFSRLTEEERASLLGYWNKKTRNLSNIVHILDRFGVKCLNDSSIANKK